MFVGIFIFIVMNSYIYKKYLLFSGVDASYLQVSKGELIPLYGMISTLALMDNITREQMTTIINYVAVYGKALSYDLSNYMYNQLKLGKFDHASFIPIYEIARSSLEDFKKFGFSMGTSRIEKFIGDFEKRDKRKK